MYEVVCLESESERERRKTTASPSLRLPQSGSQGSMIPSPPEDDEEEGKKLLCFVDLEKGQLVNNMVIKDTGSFPVRICPTDGFSLAGKLQDSIPSALALLVSMSLVWHFSVSAFLSPGLLCDVFGTM